MLDPIPEAYPTSPHPGRHIAALHWLAKQSFTPPEMTGDGVVYCAEGRYWPLAIRSVRILRALGCRLPVEIWHRSSAGEITRGDIEALDITLVDADEMALTLNDNRVPHPHGGWPAKLYALTHTRFRRALFIDADSFPLTDPTYLLDLATPAVFWAKGPQTTKWQSLGFASKPAESPPYLQGGQFAIDREACWKELMLAHWMCQHRDFFFRAEDEAKNWLIYGDEDSLQVAFTLTGQQPAILGTVDYRRGWGSRCHHNSNLIFDHPFDAKWSLPNDFPMSQAARGKVIENFVAPAYPGFSGRGIVIAAGGRYWPGAYVAVRMLRHWGCTLPVQIYYLGHRGEQDVRYEKLLEPLGVECVDIGKPLGGWEVKLEGVMRSPFEEVLYLDADNCPLADPTPLFDDEEYRATGGLYWPDLPGSRGRTKWHAWGLQGPEDPEGPEELETGQYLVNKRLAWGPLSLARLFESYSPYYYQHGHGDTGPHFVAWHALGRQFALMPSPEWRDVGLVHFTRTNTPIFGHRIQDKLSLGKTPTQSRMPNENLVTKFLNELGAGL